MPHERYWKPIAERRVESLTAAQAANRTEALA